MKSKTIFLIAATLLAAAAFLIWLTRRPPVKNHESGTGTTRVSEPPPKEDQPVIPSEKPPSPDLATPPVVRSNPAEIKPSPVEPGFGRRGGREGQDPPPPPSPPP